MQATSNANIALIKYWGKKDEELHLPTRSSLSVTLKQLQTTTQVEKSDKDVVFLNHEKLTNYESTKVIRFLDIFRKAFGITDKLKINSENNFPTAAGLASSSSGFAALAKALNKMYNLNLSKKELSILARRGSGSACRSIEKGFVVWHKENDSFAEQLFDENHWPELRIIVAIVDENKKSISSRAAMKQTMLTSKGYNEWVKQADKRINIIIEAIRNKDLDTVGKIAELDSLEMHQCLSLIHI